MSSHVLGSVLVLAVLGGGGYLLLRGAGEAPAVVPQDPAAVVEPPKPEQPLRVVSGAFAVDTKVVPREDRFELPDGNWALALNGVKNPGRLEWPKDRPWAPIVERVAGKDGVDRYKHADGSWSWTQPQWRKDLNRMDSVTVLANPTPTLPMLPEEAAANTPPPAGSPDKKP